MTPERWLQIEELYHATLERDPNERASFLAEACAGDESLCREVETLLRCDARAENFIEAPALEIAARLRAEERAQSMTGQKLGNYKILSLLGVGGMGEVYLAEDTKLDRKVALKLLPAEVTQDTGRLRRFVQEARAASALNHPNIITIHEVGEVDGMRFIVTEFIDGQTLRRRMAGGRLKAPAALDIATQIASALNAAHAAGITHRDIKPENVMVRRDGLVKVLDFGLAKLTERPAAAVDTEAATMIKANTDPGTVLGTPQYMAPEQARGLEVDARSDVFSLGVTLYEMVAGQPAFAGATASDVIVAILDREPAMLAQYAPGIPHELERIVSKALRKDREERYQTVKDLLLDLKSLKRELEVADFRSRSADSGNGSSKSAIESSATSSAEYLVNSVRQHKIVSAVVSLMLMALVGFALWMWAGRGGEKAIDSIAILPFDNVGADPNTEYLSDGIPETLINSLAQLPNLRVIPRSTAFSFKKTDLLPHKIGEKLGVRAVLTGKVTQRGDSLIIQADLIDVERDSTMWGDRYDRKIANILAVEEEISREVAGKLRLRLSGAEREQLTKRSPKNTEAYDLYLRGRYHVAKNNKEGFDKGKDYFYQAIALDQNYALAYVGLAYYYIASTEWTMPGREAGPKAKEMAMKAVAIDDELAEAHTSLGVAHFWFDWDWPAAEREFRRAIAIKPTSAEAHLQYGMFLVAMGRFDMGIAENNLALELEPLSVEINRTLGLNLINARRPDQAIKQLRKTLDLDPNDWWAHEGLGQAYVQKGNLTEAIAEMNKARLMENDITDPLALLGYAYAISGRKNEARKKIDELKERSKRQYVTPFFIAMVYAGLGEKDQAFAWLEKAYEDRSMLLVYLKADPEFDSLSSDPRYADLLRRVNLPQ